MSTFKIDFFELAFLAEACIPNKVTNFKELDWRRIPGYDYYIINSFGDVISLSRTIIRSNGAKQKIHPKLLNPCIDKKGYLFVRLCDLGSAKSIKIHQLVAMTFLGHVPCGMDSTIDHVDNNKLNNHYSNLQIISSRENMVKSLDKSKTTSKFVGVCFDKIRNKWRASISFKNKTYFLGRFNTEEEAKMAYVNKLKSNNK